jgi:hypothetical protein
MTEDYKAPDGTDLPGPHLLPPRLSPSESNILRWMEERITTETIKPKWWQFWGKPTTLTKQVRMGRRLEISDDLADYIGNNADRAVGLIWSFSERRPSPRLLNVTLERTPRPTAYICTSGSEKAAP